ncbi:protein-glutamine gamma-glutamyltransferase 5-like [Pelodytes ibericus]
MDQDFLLFTDLQRRINNTEHRTIEIDSKRLIVRRGQKFKIRLDFKKNSVDKHADYLRFTIEPGTPNQQQYGKNKYFQLSTVHDRNCWSASVINRDSKSMEISIFIPSDAIIGHHVLKVQSTHQRQYTNISLGKLIILFNPWCQDDAVFLENEEEKQEYVMNENGFVYVGNANWINKRSWNYGQFDEDIVDICLALLDRSLNHLQDPVTDYCKRNDPVYISRIISAMINSNDDNGVIVGRWQGSYTDGTSPTKWNGSNVILRQWYNSRFKPVKYGQCWVYASIICTVMRCLGVPTRVITNFDSAHDTDGNLFVDEYYDIHGEMLTDTRDSIWNFHVWNECWMARKDLPIGYGGWQVLDATPQEKSRGVYCCGPTSVKAIKEGDIHLDYDGSFVFAEVNADVISWVVKSSTAKKEKLYQNSKRVGKIISTKSIGSDAYMDVTSNYKYAEGSDMERKVFEKALERIQSTGSRIPLASFNSNSTAAESNDLDHSRNPAISDTGLNLKLKLLGSAVFGQDLQVALLSSNQTTEKKKLNMNMSVQAMENNGRPQSLVKQESSYLELDPQTEVTTEFKIPYSSYKLSITESNLLKVSIVGQLVGTNEKLLVERKITLDTPSLDIKVDENVVFNEPFTVKITFTNSLLEEIGNGVLTAEGSGLLHERVKLELGTIKVGSTFKIQIEVTPFKFGRKKLQVLFTSDQIKSITGYKDINVLP